MICLIEQEFIRFRTLVVLRDPNDDLGYLLYQVRCNVDATRPSLEIPSEQPCAHAEYKPRIRFHWPADLMWDLTDLNLTVCL